MCESTLQPDSCQLKPQEGAAKMGKVSSVSTITLKDVVTVFSSVFMCVKRLGVHAPLSSQMVFASDAVFSINLQSFFTHITYCKASAHTHTQWIPLGEAAPISFLLPFNISSPDWRPHVLLSQSLPSERMYYIMHHHL